MTKGSSHTNATVHVVLDTNVLYVDADDKLINDSTSTFILREISDLGVEIKWYLPAVVKGERRRQMTERAALIFSHLDKVETLLGIKLGITDEFLATKIEEVICREMTRHGLLDLNLDAAAVGWDRVIRAAVEKKPPFSPGKNEKGFKDAIIAETFVQLVDGTTKSPDKARLVFVCQDELLRVYSQARVSDRKNARVVESLDDLRTILNAIASDVSQETIEKIISKAHAMFFEKDKSGHLYGRWGIGNKLTNDPASKRTPEPGFTVTSKNNWIGSTTFIGKLGQTVSFSTTVWIETVVSKSTSPTLSSADFNAFSGRQKGSHELALNVDQILAGLGSDNLAHKPRLGLLSQDILTSQQYADALGALEPLTRKGRHTFEVLWSATFTQHGNLTKPTFGEFKEKGTTWS